MATVSFSFSLSHHASLPPPHARIWLDANGNGNLSDGEEVRLTNEDLSWRGEKRIRKKSAEGLLFVVSYVGTKGATWSLEVEDEGGKLYESEYVIRKTGAASVVGRCSR